MKRDENAQGSAALAVLPFSAAENNASIRGMSGCITGTKAVWEKEG